ncbi:hypothetical protein [Methanocella sp. MCL-LM]|uniref:hypothetical protein n=1 Tax=Methanocella sp. MCL-LM TaxID=3412035 RepID=UPI003C785056
MKLTVIIVATLLLACTAAGVAVAQKVSGEPVLNDLDSLTLRADDLSNRVESQLVDLNIASGSGNNTSATGTANPDAIRSIAARGVSNADTYEAQLSEIEKGLWAIQSRYNQEQYGHGDATAIESRMSYLENRIGHIRNMINDMRISADRISRTA